MIKGENGYMKKSNILFNIKSVLILIILTALSILGCSDDDSGSKKRNPDRTPPGLVEEFTVKNTTDGGLLITWTDPADPDFSYVEIIIAGAVVVRRHTQ